MGEILLEWARNIIFFMVFLSVISHLLADASYEKYIRFFAGIKTNSMAYAVKGADRLHNLQSAFCANEKFRKKYIRETLDWYMKFRPEIPEVVAELIESLSDDEEKEKFRAEIEHFVEK